MGFASTEMISKSVQQCSNANTRQIYAYAIPGICIIFFRAAEQYLLELFF